MATGAVQTMEKAACQHFDVVEAVNHDTGEEDYYGPLDENGEPYYNEKTKAVLIERIEGLEKIFNRQPVG